jgi:hypothetical protein
MMGRTLRSSFIGELRHPALLASRSEFAGCHDPTCYLHLHWFHAKVSAAIVVIALHHVIGGKAKKAGSGSMQVGRNGGILAVGLFVFALVAVVLVSYRTVLVP